jgi:endonuclease/exonuclease/phosphatase family metal-dependent hydrolase
VHARRAATARAIRGGRTIDLVLYRGLCVVSGLLIACSTASPRAGSAIGPVARFMSGHRSESDEGARVEPSSHGPARSSLAALKIATFNIQIFGKTKARNPAILSQLAAVIRGYDVVAVQEIKDVSGQAPLLLLEALNREGPDYAMLLSARTGLQPDDLRSQEQYAVYYATRSVESLSGERLYDDSAQDRFQREPYLTHLKSRRGNFSFVLIDIHTRPERALAEIEGLEEVFASTNETFAGEQNVIALGDFNAGCSYASSEQLDALGIRGPGYRWIVPDDSDSNVAPGSACAYDRIVTTPDAAAAFTGRWGVEHAFTDTKVSDHWPVWAELSIDSSELPVALR